MAIEIGTATSYKDLLAKLRTFLTGLAADPWVSERYTTGAGVLPDELILKGVGNGGGDEIYVGIQTFADVAADYYNWRLGGFTGFDAGLAFAAQPGAMTRPSLTLWNSTIPYWFVANGRRFIVVAKISTVYVSMYAGFITPYASPAQYPYPLAVGGNLVHTGAEPALTSVLWRWSNTATQNRNYPMGIPTGSIATYTADECALRLRMADGSWKGFVAGGASALNDNMTSPNGGTLWPYSSSMLNIQRNLGSTVQYPLLPIILHGNEINCLGELDGVFATTGQSLAVEDLIQYVAQDYLAVQNVHRTSREEYFAVRLV